MSTQIENIPVISFADKAKIENVIAHLATHEKTKYVAQLISELERAVIKDEADISDDIIRIESFFTIQEIDTGKEYSFQLTLPKNSDFKEGKISLLSAMGVALIGFSKNNIVNWELPGGMKKIKIIKVSNP